MIQNKNSPFGCHFAGPLAIGEQTQGKTSKDFLERTNQIWPPKGEACGVEEVARV